MAMLLGRQGGGGENYYWRGGTRRDSFERRYANWSQLPKRHQIRSRLDLSCPLEVKLRNRHRVQG